MARVSSLAILVIMLLGNTARLHAAGTPEAICAAAKQKAAGKKVAEKLKCHSKGLINNAPVDSTCLAKAEVKFSKAFAKAEAKGGCVVTGDEATIEFLVDTNCVDTIVTFTPVTTTTTTTQPCQAVVGGFCWYASVQGDSCTSACANAGRSYDAATGSYAGSTGTDANCQAVATGLGFAGFFAGTGSAGGIGCAEFGGTAYLRDTDPTTAGALVASFSRACACQ